MFTGTPSKQGDYLVSKNKVHFDGVRVLSDGRVICYPTDSRTSEFVLSSEHDYVQQLMSGRYEVISLCYADRAERVEHPAQKRSRLLRQKRERKRQKK